MTKIPCCCDTDGNQLSLLHFHTAPKNTRTPTGVRYTKYHPKTHQMCDDCIAAINRDGITVTPPPRPVRWRRTSTNGNNTQLCQTHKDQRQEQE